MKKTTKKLLSEDHTDAKKAMPELQADSSSNKLLITYDKVEINDIKNLFCKKTYLSLLLGIPNEGITEEEMADFQSTVLQLNYGEDDPLYKKFIYTLPPKMVEVEYIYGKKYSRLPKYACAARLVSNTIISDKDSDLSEVILIFYLESNPIINGINFSEIVKNLSWNKIAHDTSFW